MTSQTTLARPPAPASRERPRPLFLIEINELCPPLIADLMERGLLPAFRRFHDAATIYTTDAEETGQNLEPWIQWLTVHSGLPFSEHGIFHLGDGRGLEQDCVASVLSDAGQRVGVFGSMNTNYGARCETPGQALDGYVIPDPWDRQGRPHPDWLAPFFEIVARQVQESSAEDADLSLGEKARLGWFLMRHGLSAGTAAAAVRQLVAEKRDPGVRWRRALLLDRIQYDLFRRLNRRYDVRFATFFSNATAHFQHYFWRHMDPDAFDAPPPADDPLSYRDAIVEGYKANDRLLGRFMDDYPDAVLVLATALSQQPWTETLKCTYRPRSFADLLAFAGIDPETASVKPVMAEQFHVELPDVATATSAAEALRALLGVTRTGRERLLYVEQKGTSVFSGCRFDTAEEAEGAVVARADADTRPFGTLFHRVHTTRSGRHHPDGVLWIRGGAHEIVNEKVSLTRIAPTILSHFGVAAPAHMRGEPLPFAVAASESGRTAR